MELNLNYFCSRVIRNSEVRYSVAPTEPYEVGFILGPNYGHMKIYSIFILICSLTLVGCNEETLPPQSDRVGFEFFPLEAGLYRTYDVEQIDFSVISSDTSRFQLKEVVIDSFLNVEDDYTYILHRFTREDENVEWGLDSVWTARRTGALAVMVENNVAIVKLVFPIDNTTEWDGNSLNGRATQLFRIEDISTPLSISDTTYNETVTVIQNDIDNLIIQDERKEVYVRGVGLAHKDFVVLNFCARDDCLGQGIIESGQIVRFDLIDHGKE